MTFVSTTNQISLDFLSDKEVALTGFEIFYLEVSDTCGGVLTDTSGFITLKNEHSNRNDCYWLIHLRQDSPIMVHFLDMGVEFHPSCK